MTLFISTHCQTILAAIILSCIKGMLLRAMDIKRFFRRSKLDGTLWLGTLLAILLATPDKGLITCFVLMIVSLAYRSSHCRVVVGNKSCTALLAASSESATRPTCLLHQVVRVEGLVNFSNYEGICKNLEKVIAKWMRGYKQRLRSKRLLEQLDPTCQQILSVRTMQPQATFTSAAMRHNAQFKGRVSIYDKVAN